MNKILRFIKNKKAETYFSLTISFFIIMVVFIAILMALPIFTKKQDLDRFAKTLIRQAEIDGTVEQDELYSYLCNMYNMTPDVDWEWEKYKNSKKVQLNHHIKVELETDFLFDVGGVLHQIVVPLKSVAYGKSEVYWK